MKICFFGYINLEKKEGASLSLLNVMDEMVKRGNEVYFVVNTKDLIPQLESRGIKCIYLWTCTMRKDISQDGLVIKVKYWLKSIINNIAIQKGKQLIKKESFDIIHINGIDNYVAAKIATKLEIPYFWHIRQFLQEDLGKTIVKKEITMEYLKRANGVIGISNAVKVKYEEILNREVALIYNGLPIKQYEIGNVNRFSDKVVKILIAGRITENKGQLEAVLALAFLKKQGIKNIHLTIVGNAETEYLLKLTECIKTNNLEMQVSIFDYCDNLNELRRNSDIGLVCSKNEAFGRVTIEYMLSGMLTIGSNTGGTLELIKEGQNGLFYEQGNYLSLAEKIKYVLENKEESIQMANNAKIMAKDKFSIERVCDEILELYLINN